MMKVHAAASVTETNQFWVAEDDLQMIMPTLSVEVFQRFCYFEIANSWINVEFDTASELNLFYRRRDLEWTVRFRSDLWQKHLVK